MLQSSMTAGCSGPGLAEEAESGLHRDAGIRAYKAARHLTVFSHQ